MTRLRTGITVFLLLSAALGWAKKGGPLVYRNTGPEVAYVGSNSCASADCHEDLCQRYAQTPMGRSMAPANSPSERKGAKADCGLQP